MKLFWKQFIMIMCFSIAPLAVVGNAMIRMSFQASLDRATEIGLQDMEGVYRSLMSSLQNMPENYLTMDIVVAGFGKSLQKGTDARQDGIIIYNSRSKWIVFKGSDYVDLSLSRKMSENYGKSSMWQVAERNGRYYLEAIWSVRSGSDWYFLELHRNLDHVYQDRTYMTYVYMVVIVLVFVLLFTATLIMSGRFTKPIRVLSQASREFAEGNYKKRVRVRGKDEVALLGNDFNRMADQIESGIGLLEEDSRRKEDFIAAFSHEMKTPLTSIIGYADMLRTMKMPPDQQFLSVDYIFRQGKRLERLSRKMMELIYMNRKNLKLTEVSVEHLAEKLENMIMPYMKEKGLVWKRHTEPGTIRGDMDLLLSLFSNLVDNARKACQSGGCVALEGKSLPDGYYLEVRDDGKGIPEEEIHKITEMFYMVDKSRSREEGGSGIGMALCEKIILLHGARWEISSKLGEGTTVGVWFPAGEQRGENV